MLQKFSVAITIFVLTGGAAIAEAHHEQLCGNLNPAIDGDADRAFQCITDLETRIDELAIVVEKQTTLIATLTTALANAVPAVGDDLNTAAIVAYTADKGERTCPAGWSPFEPAKDRFVVGASTEGKYLGYSIENPPVNSTGGEAEVTLTEPQMPSHEHEAGTLQANSNTNDIHKTAEGITVGNLRVKGGLFGPIGGPANFGGHDHVMSGKVATAGSNQPHNNLPPYIALYYCKKD